MDYKAISQTLSLPTDVLAPLLVEKKESTSPEQPDPLYDPLYDLQHDELSDDDREQGGEGGEHKHKDSEHIETGCVGTSDTAGQSVCQVVGAVMTHLARNQRWHHVAVQSKVYLASHLTSQVGRYCT